MLTILANLAEKSFGGIITRDESWFAHLIKSDAMFASSLAEMTATVRPSISSNTVIVTLFTANA
jgi:hypothetical protein